jgi:hypothetical protein
MFCSCPYIRPEDGDCSTVDIPINLRFQTGKWQSPCSGEDVCVNVCMKAKEGEREEMGMYLLNVQI